ncbi:hypothetical protein [Actinopolymorpha alba]|uniref:hypothetical protein n=1 Tax=Actinopolymorpha alba TaxID=533267 RepID=UPI0003688D68|nr:hypothetical protein [Actinopolymorpha alba]
MVDLHADTDVPPLPDEVCVRAGAHLSQRFGTPVSVTAHEVLNHEGHAFVARIRLAGAPVDAAIVKLAHRNDTTGAFDPTDAEPWSPATRLWNEWAGLEFLSSLPEPPAVVPAFYGGDAELGFVLMEDLGAGPSLANVLLADTPERATAALGGYVDAFAAIHLATFEQAPAYDRVRQSLGPVPPQFALAPGELATRLPEGLAQLDGGVTIDPAAVGALRWIESLVHQPGSWTAYRANDCCPDNNRVYADGTVRLFDLEFGGVGHALLDLAYLRTMMPTCWCVRRLPAGLSDLLVERYRHRLAAAGREVPPAEFAAALNACQAYWALQSGLGHLGYALDAEGAERKYFQAYDFHLGSRRQLALQRMDELTDAARRQPELAPLAGVAEQIRTAARRRWDIIEPLPFYPAFSAR